MKRRWSALYFAVLLTEHNPTSWIGTKVTAQADGEVRIRQRHAGTGEMETTRYKFAGLGHRFSGKIDASCLNRIDEEVRAFGL